LGLSISPCLIWRGTHGWGAVRAWESDRTWKMDSVVCGVDCAKTTRDVYRLLAVRRSIRKYVWVNLGSFNRGCGSYKHASTYKVTNSCASNCDPEQHIGADGYTHPNSHAYPYTLIFSGGFCHYLKQPEFGIRNLDADKRRFFSFSSAQSAFFSVLKDSVTYPPETIYVCEGRFVRRFCH